MEKGLDLDLSEDSYYIPKAVFEYPELNIKEVRLLLVLSTKVGLTVDTMDWHTKMWIANNKSYNNKDLKEYERRLIDRLLINCDGTGYNLMKEGLSFLPYNGSSLNLVESSKNLRQLFINSLHLWHRNSKMAILSVSTFEGLFGKETRIINQSWKFTLNQTGYKYTWIKKQNKIFINPVSSIDNGLNTDKKVITKKKGSAKKGAESKVVEVEEIFDTGLKDNPRVKKYNVLDGFANAFSTNIPEPSVDVSKLDFDDTDYDRFPVVGENTQ